MNGALIHSVPPTKKTISTLMLVLLLVSSILPLSANAGSKTTTLTGGISEGSVIFPASGGTDDLSLTLPYSAILSNGSIGLEGLPSTTTASFNHSKSYDFGPGKFDNVVLKGDRLTLATKDHWWNTSYYYRFEVDVNSSNKIRDNIVVTMNINMTQLMLNFGLVKDFDKESLRIVEHKQDGSFVVYNITRSDETMYLVPYSIVRPYDYDQVTNANLTLNWTVKGIMPVNTTRSYSVYFDTLDRAKIAPDEFLKYYDDIVTSSSGQFGGNVLEVFLSDFNGTHDKRDEFLVALGNVATKPQIADVNQDGYMDIIVPEFWVAQIDSTVYFGGPQGYGLNSDLKFPTVGAVAAEAADFNKDGYMDLVFACKNNGSNYRINSTLFYGGPNGYKKTPDVKFNTTGASDVGVLDINSDGRLDLAFSSYNSGPGWRTNGTIFLQSPTGFKYEPDKKYNTYQSKGVAVGDLNMDGIDDVVFVNERNATGAWDSDSLIYFGNKTGVFTGPSHILGNMTGGIDIVDVNSDGYNDVVEANNGIVYSYIFYHNDTNEYLVPTLKLKTDGANDVGPGDLNGDGKNDLVFARWVLPPDKCKAYVWCCSGYIETSVRYFNANKTLYLAVDDVDRYHMDLDKDPPVLSVSSMENKYVSPGNFTSPIITTPDRVVSAVATWKSLQPAGSLLQVYLSNNGGVNWTQTVNTNGLVFDTEGRQLMYKIEFGTLTETPSLLWINVTHTDGGYPADVTVDLGADGTVDWMYDGIFNTTYIWNTSSLLTALDLHTTPARFDPWENITIPIEIYSNTSGIVRVFAINLTHNSEPYLKKALPETTFDEDGQALAAFELDNYFGDLDNDTLTYTVQGNQSVYIKINTGNVVDYKVRPDWAGKEAVTFVANDGNGGILLAKANVTVRSVNDLPKAVIARSPRGSVTTFTNITFDGTNSTDVDGKINQFTWSFDDGTYALGPVVSHAYKKAKPGYNVVLTVIDDGGLSAKAQITVVVENQGPIAKLRIVDQSASGFDTNTNVGIDMSGTMDKDGTIASFDLDFGDHTHMSSASGGPPAMWEHQYKDGTGTYILKLTVIDDSGQKATATVSVLINDVGPKIITVNAPSTVYVNQKASFGVVARDTDGNITRYQWDFEGDQTFSWSNNASGSASHKYKKAGEYNATLKVTDDDGKIAYYSVKIKVENSPTDAGMGLALVLGILLLAIAVIMIYYILNQRSIILRQRDLLVKRDETLRNLQKELAQEGTPTKGVSQTKAVAPKEIVDEDEEDLGTLEPIEVEKPKPAPTIIPAAITASSIISENPHTTIAPSESTGIMGKETPPPPPPSYGPKGLPDMMGAAQNMTVPLPPKVEKPAEKEEEPEEEEEEEEEPATETKKVLAKARCPGCKSLIPLYSLERPMRIKCDSCGKEGVIK